MNIEEENLYEGGKIVDNMFLLICQFKDLTEDQLEVDGKQLLVQMDDMLDKVGKIAQKAEQNQALKDFQAKIDKILPPFQSCHKLYEKTHNSSDDFQTKVSKINTKATDYNSQRRQVFDDSNSEFNSKLNCQRNCEKLINDASTRANEFFKLPESKKFQVVFKVSYEINEILASLQKEVSIMQFSTDDFPDKIQKLNITVNKYNAERDRLTRIMDVKLSNAEVFDEITQYNMKMYKKTD